LVAILTFFTSFIPCIAISKECKINHYFNFFEDLKELKKHLQFSPSDEYKPDSLKSKKNLYDFDENVYKKLKGERWI
ncbi:hypothetical protein C1645_837852, partial [Glomus cerebriforme]